MRYATLFRQLGIFSRLSAAPAVVWLLIVGMAICLTPGVATADDNCDDDAEQSISLDEESVLVATRQAEDGAEPSEPSPTPEEETKLKPISQTTDHEPELADLPRESEEGHPTSTAPETKHAKKSRRHESVKDAPQPPSREPQHAAPPREAPVPAEHHDEPSPVPAEFNGVQPGISTTDDVVEQWGEPAETNKTDGGKILRYETEPFRAIEVLIKSDFVDAIKIELQDELDARQLAKQLRMEAIEPVDVTTDDGEPLGRVYPERGIVFLFGAGIGTTSSEGSPPVSHVVVQPLDAEAFAARAESHLHGPYEKNINDLKYALVLDDQFAHADWLLAEIYIRIGQPDLAKEAALRALEASPDDETYQLCLARCLLERGDYDEAVFKTRAVIDRRDISRLTRAQALHQMGLLATLGDSDIASKAIGFHTDAIELANELADSGNRKERLAAKRLMVEAHLAVARHIARQKYANQFEAVGRWMERASSLAEECIEKDGGSLELRLRVTEQGLATLADLRSPKDPKPWVAEAKATVNAMSRQWDDNRWQDQLAWQLGKAYLHALRIEHSRRETASALRYGQLAVEELADGARSRQAAPPSERLVGQLYFHIGAVHAVHQENHAKAIYWYDKAEPLLTSLTPVNELIVPRWEGEALVSMGVSYWQEGEVSDAVDLTESGATLIHQAVDGGVLDRDTLNVPYSNLAAMNRQLGNDVAATKYSQLASSSLRPQKSEENQVVLHQTPRSDPTMPEDLPRRMVHREPPTPRSKTRSVRAETPVPRQEDLAPIDAPAQKSANADYSQEQRRGLFNSMGWQSLQQAIKSFGSRRGARNRPTSSQPSDARVTSRPSVESNNRLPRQSPRPRVAEHGSSGRNPFEKALDRADPSYSLEPQPQPSAGWRTR